LSLSIALFVSYKKGYITKRNVLLVKLSSFAIGSAILSYFVAKGLFLYGLFGTQALGTLWIDIMIGSIFPTLFILAAILGLTHIVCQNMRTTLKLKEEIDGTV